MLTSAFGPALSTATKGYELRELAGLLDHIHLMYVHPLINPTG